MIRLLGVVLWVSLIVQHPLSSLRADERVEHFDRDPQWETNNSHSNAFGARPVRQDFGFRNSAHAGGRPGELGGFITPAAEPAYYAKKIPEATFADPLMASGTFAGTDRSFHILLTFFNSKTLNEWRTPNTIAIRLSGRGDVCYAWLEYTTQKWRAGGDSPLGFATPIPNSRRTKPKEFRLKGQPHRWSLRYDPAANGGTGSITATIDSETAICHLTPGHKADGAKFDRFGLLNVMKSVAAGGEVWLDDLEINGVREDFARDPHWDALNNHKAYQSTNVRPRFDFGYSATQFCGGKTPGELGGLVFRGDCRYPERMGSYADKLETLTLAKPILASGQISLRRGVTDSSALLGFFDSKQSLRSNPSQSAGLPVNFLGIQIDGPSREGFLVAPAFRAGAADSGKSGPGADHIYPDGKVHDWKLRYQPGTGGKRPNLEVSLGQKTSRLELEASLNGVSFDRFGIITTWIDGNGQTIYFDDLTYTWKQP
ncbi:hypothetical protein BH10PLA2_BH10PLA2_07370 [soil metagenome]